MENKNLQSLQHQEAEIQLTYRSNVKPSQRPKVDSSRDAFEIFCQTWDLDKIELMEQFKVMLLNRANKVLGIFGLSTGGVSGTVADPKLIFAAAIKSNATSIILAHNHPSGNLKPSESDINLTRKVKEGGKFLEIAVLDHIIVTTVWLSLNQISELFNRDKSVISRHLNNVFKEKELARNSVVAKNATTASDGKTYEVDYFNLDAIISVGYRVNSKQGTQFRQWATQRLKDHLVKGYSFNQKRLEQLQQTIQIIEKSGHTENLSLSEAKGLLSIISNYTQSFILLNQFNRLASDKLNENITYEIQYDEAVSAIAELKRQLIKKKEARIGSQCFAYNVRFSNPNN